VTINLLAALFATPFLIAALSLLLWLAANATKDDDHEL